MATIPRLDAPTPDVAPVIDVEPDVTGGPAAATAMAVGAQPAVATLDDLDFDVANEDQAPGVAGLDLRDMLRTAEARTLAEPTPRAKLIQFKPDDDASPAGLPPELVEAYKQRFGTTIDEDVGAVAARRQASAIEREMMERARVLGLNEDADAAEAVMASEADRASESDGTTLQQTVNIIRSVVGDIGTAVTRDGSNIIIGGPLRAFRNSMNLVTDVAQFADVDPSAVINDPELRARIQQRLAQGEGLGDFMLDALPDFGTTQDAESVTGQILQSVVQFLVPFAAMGRVKSVTDAMVRGALVEFSAFDGQEGNLANLLQLLPGAERNAVLEFLATDQETPEIEGRLKNALTGLLGGALAEGMFAGIRAVRHYRLAKQKTNAADGTELEEKLIRTVDPRASSTTAAMPENDVLERLEALLGGKETDPLVRLERRIKPIDFEVPDQVVARALAPELPALPDPEPGMSRLWIALDPKDPLPTTGEYHLTPAAAQRAKYPDIDFDESLTGDGLRDTVRQARDRTHYAYIDVPGDQLARKREAITRDGSEPVYRIRAVEDGMPQRPQPTTNTPPPVPDVDAKPFINWNRIQTSDDIAHAMKEMAEGFSDDIARAQRGVRTNAQTARSAAEVNAWRTLLDRRKGQPLNAEQTLALRNLWVSSGEQLVELSRAAQTGGPSELFAFRRMMAIHNVIQQEVMAVRTETARALQQWRIPAGGSRETMQSINDALLQSGGDDVARRMATLVNQLATLPNGSAKIDKFARDVSRVRTKDIVSELFFGAVLSGPKTHAVNAMSNSAVTLVGVAERAIAGRLGHVIDPLDGVRLKEASYMLYGQTMALRDMWRFATATMRMNAARATGRAVDPEQMPASPFVGQGQDWVSLERQRQRAISAESLRRPAVKGDGEETFLGLPMRPIDPNSWFGRSVDAVGSIVNLPGDALGAADVFFKTINYRASLHAAALRMADEEVARGLLDSQRLRDRIVDLIDAPPERLRTEAMEFAKTQTFTGDPGPVANSVTRLRGLIDGYSGRNTGVPVGTMILPFIRTPANILSYTFERTPLAVIGARFRAAMRAGGVERDMAIAKVSLGTAAMLTFYDMAMDGHFTGSGPKGRESNKRATMMRSGWQPYSVRFQVGEHEDGSPIYRHFAYNRMDPVGYYIGFAADFADVVRNTDGRADVQLGEAFAAGVFGVAENITDKAYFSGVAALVEAINDPDHRSEAFMNRLAASFIPAGVREWKNALDPVARHTHDLLTELMAKSPYHSTQVPPRLDFWGREIEYVSGLGPVFDIVSPIYSRNTERAQPIDREFLRLDYNPRPASAINVRLPNGETRRPPLRNMPEARNDLIRLTGATPASELIDMTVGELRNSTMRQLTAFGDRTLREVLNDMVTGRDPLTSLDYELADDDQKQKLLQRTISAFADAARIETIRRHPRIMDIAESMLSRSARGVEAPF